MYEKSGIVWELSIRSFLLPLLGGICNSAATFSRKPVFALRPRGPRHRIAAVPSAVSSTCFQTFHLLTRAGQGRLPACQQAGAATDIIVRNAIVAVPVLLCPFTPLLGGICNSAATFSRKPVFALRPRGPRHRIAAAPSAVSSTCFQTFHLLTRAGQGRLPACRQAGAAIGIIVRNAIVVIPVLLCPTPHFPPFD